MYKCITGPASSLYINHTHFRPFFTLPRLHRMSASQATPRNLVIRWKPAEFTRDVKLSFAFSQPGSTNHTAALVWRQLLVSAYPKAKNISWGTVEYTGKIGVGSYAGDTKPATAQVETFTPLDAGKATQLQRTPEGNTRFTEPVTPEVHSATYEVTNMTGSKRWISLGTLADDMSYYPFHAWNIGDTMSMAVNFEPTLMAFVSYGTENLGSHLSVEIVSSRPFWTKNLLNLSENTVWDFRELPSGAYALELVDDIYPHDTGKPYSITTQSHQSSDAGDGSTAGAE